MGFGLGSFGVGILRGGRNEHRMSVGLFGGDGGGR